MDNDSKKTVFDKLETVIERILKVLYLVAAISAVPMAILVAGSAIGRYILNQPISGSTEMTSLLLLIMMMCGEAYCQFHKGNACIGAIVDRFSPRAQSGIDTFNYLLCTLVSVALGVGGFMQATYNMEKGTFISALKIPIGPFYYIMAFGWFAIALASLLVTIREFRKVVTK